MFETLFGSEIPLAARFFIAFLVVLALIGLTAWLVRRFGANRLGGGSARGRQPRLAVIDAASVDGRRRLVLIRRDNVEHLLMIGGPSDVVIEPNIVRAAAAREVSREPARAGDTLPRPVPLGDVGSWPLQPGTEPQPVQVPAPRPYRSSVTEVSLAPPDQGLRARPADSLTGMAAELSTKFNSDLGMPLGRSAPPITAREAAPAAPAQTDHNLAEMAQRLEAALRRPGAVDVHPPVTDPFAAPLGAPAAKAPEPPRVAARDLRPPPETNPAPAKTPYDNLEQEMANLLGRPSGKT
jgi:hypothetical protein